MFNRVQPVASSQRLSRPSWESLEAFNLIAWSGAVQGPPLQIQMWQGCTMLHQHHQKVPFQTVPNTTITIYRNIRLLLGKAVSVPLLNLFERPFWRVCGSAHKHWSPACWRTTADEERNSRRAALFHIMMCSLCSASIVYIIIYVYTVIIYILYIY